MPQSKAEDLGAYLPWEAFLLPESKLDPVGERGGRGSMGQLKQMGRKGKFSPTRRGIGRVFAPGQPGS